MPIQPISPTPSKPSISTTLLLPKDVNVVCALTDRLSSSSLDSVDGSSRSNNAKRNTSTYPMKPLPREISTTSENNSNHDDEEDLDETVTKIVKTAHKIAEESGMHAPEPLLTENPHRFVLFPIQDNDVRNNFEFSFFVLFFFGCCIDWFFGSID
jgi:hypothetical protein